VIGKLLMARTSKIDGMLRSLLAAMLAIFVVLSPASGAMSMQCSPQKAAAHHDASAPDSQHPIKHTHGIQIGQDGCCKSSCAACVAVLAPYALDVSIGAHERTRTNQALLLVGISSPPLLGPPRNSISTF
jgi:hypothetical protein